MSERSAYTVIGGHAVEPHGAGEVEVGWKLLIGGRVVEVTAIEFKKPREGEWERQVWIWFDPAERPTTGDEAQTVYRVVDG